MKENSRNSGRGRRVSEIQEAPRILNAWYSRIQESRGAPGSEIRKSAARILNSGSFTQNTMIRQLLLSVKVSGFIRRAYRGLLGGSDICSDVFGCKKIMLLRMLNSLCATVYSSMARMSVSHRRRRGEGITIDEHDAGESISIVGKMELVCA